MKIFQIAKENFLMNKLSIFLYSGLMALFFLWFASIYDPDLFAGLEGFYADFPEAIQSLVGGELAIDSYNTFMNTYLFSFAWMYLGLYFILKTSQDIPTEIEEKTIDIMLSKPINRWEFVLGKLITHLMAILVLMGLVILVTLVSPFIFPLINPAETNYVAFLLSFILLGLHLLSLSATGFIFSTYFSRKKALALSFGALVFFYATGNFYGLFPEFIQDIKYLSIFYYFDTYELLANTSLEGFWLNTLVMSVYSIALIIASVLIFQKRNIPV